MRKCTPSLAEFLRAQGLRNTPQRALIYQILCQSEEHLDAEGIWRLARQQDATVNLATVYRTLTLFLRVGLVRQSYISDESKRVYYEVGRPEDHVHFVCVKCGKVLEMDSDDVPLLFRKLEDEYKVKIFARYVQMEGLCNECLKKNSE